MFRNKRRETYSSGVGFSCADGVEEEIPDCIPAPKPFCYVFPYGLKHFYVDSETSGQGLNYQLFQH